MAIPSPKIPRPRHLALPRRSPALEPTAFGFVGAGQGGAGWQRGIAQRVQMLRQVGHAAGNQMDHVAAFVALDMAGDGQKAAAQHLAAELLEDLGPHHDVGHAGFVLQGHEDDATIRKWAVLRYGVNSKTVPWPEGPYPLAVP